jgi:two-component system, OmpR family, sensor histidine kinase QseC
MTLATRLFIGILPTIALAITFVGYLAYISATAEIDHVYDAQLISDANTMWVMLNQRLKNFTSDKKSVFPDPDFHMGNQLRFNDDADDDAEAHILRVWKGDKLALMSQKAFPETTPAFREGFSDLLFMGQIWRVYALPIPDTDVTLEVAENTKLRSNLVYKILFNIVIPLIVLVPLIGALTWMIIHNGLKQLRELTWEIRSRGTGNLTQVDIHGLPRDMLPLKNSLNQLLSELERSLKAERHFTDLAAHQLRTPQSSMKLLIQMIGAADTEEERLQLIDKLSQSSERAIHVIEQILRLTRVRQQSLHIENFIIQDMIDSIVADFGINLSIKKITVENNNNKRSVLWIDRFLLELIITNILDNAIKYCPNGGRIKIEICDKKKSHWKVSITDTGPGIPVQQHRTVFLPFNRLDAKKAPGSGLGMTIVADAAARLGIIVELSTPLSGVGLQVDLLIPR